MMKWKLLVLIYISIGVMGFECPRLNDTEGSKAIAFELILNEFSGARISGMESHQCLNQDKFKYVRPLYSPSNEYLEKAEYIVKRSSIVIDDIKLINELIHKYEVSYSFKAVINNEKKLIKDQLQFIRNTDPKNIFMYGCAFTSVAPTYIALLKECSDEN